MTNRYRARRGDVVSIPVDDAHYVAAQIVDFYRRQACFVAVFEPLYAQADEIDLSAATRERLVFIALTFDGRIVSGDWRVLGNVLPAEDLPFPAYQVDDGGIMSIEDHTGKISRRLESGDPELPQRTFVAPMVLERAVRAKHGRESWDSRYDSLVPPKSLARDDTLFSDEGP